MAVRFTFPKVSRMVLQTLADNTEVFYQMSEFYHPERARGIGWNDPAFGIAWPEDQRQPLKRDMAYMDYSC